MKRKDWIVFFILLAITISLGYGLYRMFSDLVPALLTVLAGGIGFVVSKIYEINKREIFNPEMTKEELQKAEIKELN